MILHHLSRCAPAEKCLMPTIIKGREEMFFRLGFSWTLTMKLVDDQVIDFPWPLANISDEDIATICDMIRRPGG